MLDQIVKHIRLPYTISDLIGNNIFEIVMKSLAPTFIMSDTVRFLHPLILTYLFRIGRCDLLALSERARLIRFLDFLETIRTRPKYMQLYLDDRLDEITRTNKSQVLAELIRLTNLILISKLLRHYF